MYLVVVGGKLNFLYYVQLLINSSESIFYNIQELLLPCLINIQSDDDDQVSLLRGQHLLGDFH